MKKQFFQVALVAVTVMAGVAMTACGSSKQAAQRSVASTQQSSTDQEIEQLKRQMELDKLKGEADRAAKQREADAAIAEHNAKMQAERLAAATEQPCQLYDDAEWFTGTGVRRVKLNSLNTAATALLRSTQQQLRLKLKGVYKAVVRDYFDQMDMDEGSYAVSHIESAGDYIIDQKCNETYEACRKNTAPDAEGYVTLYMGIKVSKKAVVEEIINEISKDKKMEVRFN
ncbi:MAG: hypothetical protein LBS16_03995, partial [Prevotellaceae bacterium]|nr:hypothetical protein [Prevotellaceae bacterium]